MFVTALFYLANDLSDEMNFTPESAFISAESAYANQRRWAMTVKVFSSFYILIAICLVIYQQKERAALLSDKLGSKSKEITDIINAYNSYSHYRFHSALKVSSPDQNHDPVLDFV